MARKYMDLQEFVERGYLQEVNRIFLHRLGLALEVTEDEDGLRLTGIQDVRDDPEGMIFGAITDLAKAQRVHADLARHDAARLRLFGWTVQPVGTEALELPGKDPL